MGIRLVWVFKMDKKKVILELNDYLKRTKMSLTLKTAMGEIIKAIKGDNIGLAEELTAVKSFICGCEQKEKDYHKLGGIIYLRGWIMFLKLV